MSFKFLSVTRPYKSCHGTAEIAKYKACNLNQTTIEITEESNINKRPKTTTYIFLGHLQAKYQDVKVEKEENGLSKNKLFAFTKTTLRLRRAHGREIT